MNLGLAYKVLKVAHIENRYVYLYLLPLNKYAVVVYEDDADTMVDSQFFWEWVDALHYFNKIKEEKEEQ